MNKVSVITINFNNAIGLDKTISSVISQTYKNLEYIIVDGGSTDGSVEIIKKHPSGISRYISERDTGIYNAMNKGVSLSQGDYLLFLNSGDIFTNAHSIEYLLQSNPKEAFIYGNINLDDSKGNLKHYSYKAKLDIYEVWKESLPHPATLIKKELFDIVGPYNETDKITSDWQFFMLALFKFNFDYRHVDKDISVFSVGGISNDTLNAALSQQERETFMKTHFSEIYDKRLFTHYSYLYKIRCRFLKFSINVLDDYSLLKFLKKFYHHRHEQ